MSREIFHRRPAAESFVLTASPPCRVGRGRTPFFCLVGRGESEHRRRRCGNVEIARLCFWRDFQARWKPWKSPRTPRLLYLPRADFSTVSTGRHFHSDDVALSSLGLRRFPRHEGAKQGSTSEIRKVGVACGGRDSACSG